VTGRSIQKFRSVIESAGEGGGAFVSIPFDVEMVFGQKRVPIEATIDAEAYRGTLVRMGGPTHMLIILKGIRQRIGKGPGDTVEIVLWEDLQPRTVEVPPDLARLLKARPKAARFFEALSYTNKKEYVRWIGEAKRPETRKARITRTLALLSKGQRTR
jgi:hypothetical protein